MRPRRKGRGQISLIEKLPPETDHIIAAAAMALQDRDRTQLEIYAEFSTALEALKIEHHGELEFAIPSFTAFNRYSLKLDALTRRLEETREIAAAISKRFDAAASDDLTLIAAEAIKTLVFELLTNSGEAGLDPQGALQLAGALYRANQAQGVSTTRRLKVEKEFAADVGKAVETVAKAKGLTAETVEAIKAQVLGVRKE